MTWNNFFVTLRRCTDSNLQSDETALSHIAWEVFWTHMVGVATMSTPRLFTYVGMKFQLPTEDSVFYGMVLLTFIMFVKTLCFDG